MVEENQPVKREGESEEEFSARKSKWQKERLEERQNKTDAKTADSPLERFKRIWQ